MSSYDGWKTTPPWDGEEDLFCEHCKERIESELYIKVNSDGEIFCSSDCEKGVEEDG